MYEKLINNNLNYYLSKMDRKDKYEYILTNNIVHQLNIPNM